MADMPGIPAISVKIVVSVSVRNRAAIRAAQMGMISILTSTRKTYERI